MLLLLLLAARIQPHAGWQRPIIPIIRSSGECPTNGVTQWTAAAVGGPRLLLLLLAVAVWLLEGTL
jgi:hypothetical protein